VTLIATLLITGLATFAVGFVPGYPSIGVWGAVILTVLRLIQGIGIGGEWGGATLIAIEWAKTNAHRGFITAWPQTRGDYIRNVRMFAAFVGRSPDTATAEDLRRFQLHQTRFAVRRSGTTRSSAFVSRRCRLTPTHAIKLLGPSRLRGGQPYRHARDFPAPSHRPRKHTTAA
jgi:hypothetical protein